MAARCVIGVDLGGTKALVGAVDERLRVDYRTRRLVAGLDAQALLATLAEAVEETARSAGAPVAAVGIGVPALMDSRSGRAVTSVHLPLRDVALAEVMARRLGVAVVVDNDANCAVLAEARAGAAAGAADVVMLTIGTGIGSGLILGGRLYRGATGAGAELGHMVVDCDGPPCQGNCPNRGCLEAVASGSALLRDARSAAQRHPDTALGRALAGGAPLTGPLISELARDGDPVCREAIERIGRKLGVGIANCVNIFNPDVVVIGGGVSGAGELLLEPARREVALRALAPSRDHASIRLAGFGEEAGMVGAALLAREELLGA